MCDDTSFTIFITHVTIQINKKLFLTLMSRISHKNSTSDLQGEVLYFKGKTSINGIQMRLSFAGEGKMTDVKCGDSGCETRGVENRACFPISLPHGDPDFSHKPCHMFVRTQEVLQDDCKLGTKRLIFVIIRYTGSSDPG